MATATLSLCPSLPAVGADLKITLPFGGEIKAMRDVAQGIPTDCSLVFNLLGQIQPLLGSMTCLFMVLDVLSKLKAFVDAVPSLNPVKIVKASSDLGSALLKLKSCFPPMMVANVVCMIRDILLLVITLLECLLQFVKSTADVRATVNLEAAEGNPALLEVLNCANDNSQLTLAHALASVKPLQAIFDLLTPVMEMAQISLSLPSIGAISPDADPTDIIEKLEDAVNTLKSAVQSIPC